MSIIEWLMAGRPVPPPDQVKHAVVKEYAQKYTIRTFIETGTFLGNMIEATKDLFDQVYSIELQPVLFEQAKQRFNLYQHIHIVYGDSSLVLPQILLNIHEPCLFWLDAHFSGGDIPTARGPKETPIFEELDHILNHGYHHIILIDDARLFTGENDYPSLNELFNLIKRRAPKSHISVEDDIIRIW